MDKKKRALAEKIDAWVMEVVSAGGGDWQILFPTNLCRGNSSRR